MGGLHFLDIVVLLVLGLLIFGPKRLPELGAQVGHAIREFQQMLRDDQPAVTPSPPPPPQAPPVAATAEEKPLPSPTDTQESTVGEPRQS